MQSMKKGKTSSLKRFGLVQTLDTKSKRRLYEVLHSQDIQMNQEITFLSDGADTLRQLQLDMSPQATHILDWHHVTMKLTVLSQYGKGLVQCEAVLGEPIQDQIDDLATARIAPCSESYPRFPQLVKALSAWRTYIVNNRHVIPNYGER